VKIIQSKSLPPKEELQLAKNKLTVKTIQAAKSKEKPYKLWDGNGLHILIHPNGSKYWQLKYRIEGKEKQKSYGVFPKVKLEQARKFAEEDYPLIKEGIDPIKKSREKKAKLKFESDNFFKSITEEWVQKRIHTWKSEKHKADVLRSLEEYVFPDLGHYPVSEIGSVAVLECIRTLEDRGLGETAYRTLQRISSIFKYAIATGRSTSNPARDLTPALKKKKVVHHPSLSIKEFPVFLSKLEEYEGYFFTKAAMKLVHLTAVRSRELRHARWDEFELGGSHPLWRIPAGRMKKESEHLVPLSRQAVTLFQSLHSISGKGPLVFLGRNNPAKPLSENTMNRALWNMGYKGRHSTHGARSVFSTIANESGLWQIDAIERQLAHTPSNKIRAAYNRAEHLEERHRLMQWWADKLDELKESLT